MGRIWTFGRTDQPRAEVVAAVIATRCRPWRNTVILRDTAEDLWVAEVTPRGGHDITGPVSLDQALAAAADMGGAP